VSPWMATPRIRRSRGSKSMSMAVGSLLMVQTYQRTR
jgi:hypothetical protein